jgi:hypothetical protein
MDTPWRIDLLGWLRAVSGEHGSPGERGSHPQSGCAAEQGSRSISRFQTQKTGALLAYLPTPISERDGHAAAH